MTSMARQKPTPVPVVHSLNENQPPLCTRVYNCHQCSSYCVHFTNTLAKTFLLLKVSFSLPKRLSFCQHLSVCGHDTSKR